RNGEEKFALKPCSLGKGRRRKIRVKVDYRERKNRENLDLSIFPFSVC
ncbi:MAG: hypothetical protein ACI8RA_002097, partial [Chlamydiales bacterium]